MDPILDLYWPLELVTLPSGGVTLRTVEQDDGDDIATGLALACEVRPSDLPWEPEFGTPSALASSDPSEAAALIGQALRVIDPRPERIDVEITEHDGDRNLHLKVTAT